MEGVKEVQQLDDRQLHWKAEVSAQEKEWDAEIIEQTPDQRVGPFVLKRSYRGYSCIGAA